MKRRRTPARLSRRYTALITREGDWYIARCLELNVTTQGRTLDEARANLHEADDFIWDRLKSLKMLSRP